MIILGCLLPDSDRKTVPAAVPTILLIVFGAISLNDPSKDGYKSSKGLL